MKVLVSAVLAVALNSDLPDFANRPFTDLIEESEPYSADALRALRADIELEREKALDSSEEREKTWKSKVAAARRDLEKLNNASSVDSPEASRRRSELHELIADLTPRIQHENTYRENVLPALYEIRLAKVWLLERWPERMAEILNRIDDGRARDRQHGDIEDIGYRKIVKDNQAEDIDTGEQAARQMVASGALPQELQDDEVQDYVRRLGSRLAQNSDLQVPLRLTVLQDGAPRAIGLPGGILYVTSGVLTTARSESELAGILSLEIARIAARHATRNSTRSLIGRTFLPVAHLAAGFLTGGLGTGASMGVGYGMQGLDGIVGRAIIGAGDRHQKEADQLAIQYAWKAGYDPRGLVGFMDSLIADDRGALIAKEPPLQDRMLNMYTEIAYLPQSERPLVDSAEFSAIRLRLIGVSR